MQVENPEAREWYMREAASQRWSTRQLDRQISVLPSSLRRARDRDADSEGRSQRRSGDRWWAQYQPRAVIQIALGMARGVAA